MNVLGIAFYYKNIKKNILSSLLIALVLTCLYCVISIIEYENGKLKVFKEFSKMDGIYFDNCNIEEVLLQGTAASIKGAKRVYSLGCVATFCNTKGIYENATLLGYDKYIYDNFTPVIKSGKWISDIDDIDDEYIHVVITEEPKGIKVGDVITCLGVDTPMYVEGIIGDGNEIMWAGDGYIITSDNYEYLFQGSYFENGESFYVIARKKDIDNEVHITNGTKAFIEYDDNITDLEEKENNEYCNNNGHSIPLSYFYQKSKDNYMKKVTFYYPTLLMVIIMIGIVFIVSSVIEYRYCVGTLGILYAVGMSCGHYLKIVSMEKIIVFTIGIVMTMLSRNALILINGRSVYTNISVTTIVCWLVFLAVIYIVQITVSCITFFAKSPADIIRQRGSMI